MRTKARGDISGIIWVVIAIGIVAFIGFMLLSSIGKSVRGIKSFKAEGVVTPTDDIHYYTADVKISVPEPIALSQVIVRFYTGSSGGTPSHTDVVINATSGSSSGSSSGSTPISKFKKASFPNDFVSNGSSSGTSSGPTLAARISINDNIIQRDTTISFSLYLSDPDAADSVQFIFLGYTRDDRLVRFQTPVLKIG